MKPTPTPEMIEAAAEAIYNLFTYDEPGEKPKWIERGNSFKQEDARRYAVAALSVQPSAAVVGEPEPSTLLGDIRQKWMDLETDTEFEDWLFSSELEAYAAPSAPDGWQSIETAPRDGTRVLLWTTTRNPEDQQYVDDVLDGEHVEEWQIGYFSGQEWVCERIGHPSHWRPLPAPPALGGASHD